MFSRKRFKKLFIGYLIFFFIYPILLLDKKSISSEINLKTVGIVDNALPCSDYDNSNNIGLSVDFWREVSEKANIHYKIKTINSFNEGINEAEKGNVDLMISCFDITTNRLKRIEYSIPYRRENNAFLSKKNRNLNQLFIFKLLKDKVLIYSLIILSIFSLICSLIVYKWDNGKFDFLNFTTSRREKLMHSWTMFMVGEYGDRSSMSNGMLIILIFSFLRIAIISTLVGTAASEIFIASKPIDINLINNDKIANILYEGVGVPKGTAQENWLNQKINSLKNFNRKKFKVIKTQKGEEGLKQLLINGEVDHIFGEKRNLKNIKKSIPNNANFYISIEDPISYNQAFIFGKNLDKDSKKVINVAISELIVEGRIKFLESKWLDIKN
tara:strand:- start:1984 stop:3135 length:1152 start_codon:yes stop_codon:yes gene_type:complete